MKLLFSCLFLFFTCINAWVDVKVNQDPGMLLQNETSITVNPANPNNIVVAYNEDPGGSFGLTNGLGVSYSFDRGVTWADTQIVQVFGIEADPSIGAALNGFLFAGFITYQGFFNDTNGIFVARSSDGGITWPMIRPVDTNFNTVSNPGPFADKSYLCVDCSSLSPYVNNVYITWQKDNTNGVNSDVYFSRSTDLGNSFSPPLRISDLPPNVSQCVGQVPKTGPSGEVFVLWADFGLSGHTTGYLFWDKSLNGGVSFGTDILIDSFLSVKRFPNQVTFPGFYVRSYPTIGVDPVTAGRVYAAIAVDPDGVAGPDDGDIMFWNSIDGGITWNGPVRVNDDATLNDQFQPWMDVKQNGVIDIIWLDRRTDPLDEAFEVYFSCSTDGGQTFTVNQPVSDLVFPLIPGQDWMGEYIGIDVNANTAFIAWTDTRMGERDIFFDSIHNVELGVDEIIGVWPEFLDFKAIQISSTQSYAFEFSSEKELDVELTVHDLSGRLILRKNEHFEAGRNTIDVDLSSFGNSFFVYEFKSDNFRKTGTIMVFR